MDNMLNQITHHYWHRQGPVDEVVVRYRQGVQKEVKIVVDIGAGYDPCKQATDLVDMYPLTKAGTRRRHVVDLNCQPLPFADKEVDFIYCRHTLEDIYNPLHLCREMNRVARAGYIETLSAASEFCRSLDMCKPCYRGHAHHHYFVWSENGKLFFLPKFPIIEYIDAGEALDNLLVDHLNWMPYVWNTYHLWRGSFDFELIHDGIDLRGSQYVELILRGADNSVQSAIRFAQENGIAEATYLPNGCIASEATAGTFVLLVFREP